MWWISYRGEGKAGVDNIGVFEDDGTPRDKHPLLLDPSQVQLQGVVVGVMRKY